MTKDDDDDDIMIALRKISEYGDNDEIEGLCYYVYLIYVSYVTCVLVLIRHRLIILFYEISR